MSYKIHADKMHKYVIIIKLLAFMKMNFPLTHSALLALTFGLLCSAGAQPSETEVPGIVPHRVNPRFGGAPTAGSTSPTSSILYHGGPLLTGANNGPTVYVIWYGNWAQGNNTDTATGQSLVTSFLKGLGGSPYFDINTTYSGNGYTVGGGVTYGGQCSVGYLYGSRLSDSKVQSTVNSAISTGKLPNDPNGLYFVLSSSDVSENSGFCTRYCGWHTHATLAGTDIKYSFVGNAARCINACAAQSIGPNGNAGVDGMISVIAHELEEATSDPDLNAWYDSSGAENADKCAWTFGQTLYVAPNGAYYNMTVGGLNVLIQRNLAHNVTVNGVTGDYCAVSYTSGKTPPITQ